PENSTAATALGDLLSAQGKYSEAVEMLEAAVAAAPDSPNLQYQLGTACLKTGQKDKALSHLQKAVERNDADPIMLNNVAYMLAENKTSLDLARQYAEKALTEVEERSVQEVDSLERGSRLTYHLSLIWDTLGWVYFQSGDASRSESLVRSAWLLGQEAVVGEHLGEIYEKEGKSKAAATAYELALAALEASPLVFRPGDASRRESLTKEITARYEKLTGKKPGIRESLRLPNGQWTKTPAEQITQLRALPLGKQTRLSGAAEFTVVFAPGKIESVNYLSGEKSLNALIEKIKRGSFQVEFPAGSQAKILRRTQVGCFPVSGCTVVLMPVSAAIGPNGWGQ